MIPPKTVEMSETARGVLGMSPWALYTGVVGSSGVSVDWKTWAGGRGWRGVEDEFVLGVVPVRCVRFEVEVVVADEWPFDVVVDMFVSLYVQVDP